jgi:hypothetical protein
MGGLLRLGASGRQWCKHESEEVSIVGTRNQETSNEDYTRLRRFMCFMVIYTV